MSEPSPELLVILSDPQAQQTVKQQAQITQMISDRVFTIRGGSPAGVSGVKIVLTGHEDDGVLPVDLSEAEELFVRGWLLSRKPKTSRKGEGLAWDTPGFQPPDPKS